MPQPHETVSGGVRERELREPRETRELHRLVVVHKPRKKRDQTGPRNPNWKGGKSIDHMGYVRIWAGPNRGRYEHVVVWESIHGPLPEGWCVHHRDGIPWRNCPSNLEGIEKTVHDRISASRRWRGVCRKTAYDLTVKDFRYLKRRGVSVPEQFDVPF